MLAVFVLNHYSPAAPAAAVYSLRRHDHAFTTKIYKGGQNYNFFSCVIPGQTSVGLLECVLLQQQIASDRGGGEGGGAPKEVPQKCSGLNDFLLATAMICAE